MQSYKEEILELPTVYGTPHSDSQYITMTVQYMSFLTICCRYTLTRKSSCRLGLSSLLRFLCYREWVQATTLRRRTFVRL
jgi:hypothetical protein